MRRNMENLPIWLFASVGDRTGPEKGTQLVVEALKKMAHRRLE